MSSAHLILWQCMVWQCMVDPASKNALFVAFTKSRASNYNTSPQLGSVHVTSIGLTYFALAVSKVRVARAGKCRSSR